MATADSRTNKRIWLIINNVIKIPVIDGPVFPNKVKSRCPAIILADNRIARVPGRIIFLIDSIQTIKGIKIGGVPWGTKWANICWVLFNQPKIMKDIHKGKESIIVRTICLVLVKI